MDIPYGTSQRRFPGGWGHISTLQFTISLIFQLAGTPEVIDMRY